VLIVNKWDVIEKDTNTINRYKKDLLTDLVFMSYVPMLFISAKTGQRVNKVMETVDAVYEQSRRRIPTGQLNDTVGEAVMMNEPPSDKGRTLKIYFATQATIQPPTFVIFVNDTEIVHFSYERYLENYFRKSFGFEGTPIRLIFRNRKKETVQ
jgi:GTP-binding protein